MDDGIVIRVPWVYIVRCGDNSLYVGHTRDLKRRVWQHQIGDGADHTSMRLPVDLVYTEHHASLLTAIEREKQLKRRSAEKKGALVAGDMRHLKTLTRRRRPKRRTDTQPLERRPNECQYCVLREVLRRWSSSTGRAFCEKLIRQRAAAAV
jgi:predicted GIY-YIG superfamily endonuclease